MEQGWVGEGCRSVCECGTKGEWVQELARGFGGAASSVVGARGPGRSSRPGNEGTYLKHEASRAGISE